MLRGDELLGLELGLSGVLDITLPIAGAAQQGHAELPEFLTLVQNAIGYGKQV